MTTLSAKAEFVLVSTNGAASVVLFDPTKIPGHRVTVKNDTTQLGTTTITAAAGNIDGGSSASLIGANQEMEFEAWGGNWKIVNSSTPYVGVLGAGVVHSDSAGHLTSSLIVNADVDPAAALAVTKLASGSNTQHLVTVSSTPTWVTAGGDVTGAVSSQIVVALTGTGNVVSVPAATLLTWIGGATLGTGGITGSDAKIQGTAISFYQGTDNIGFMQYNGGQTYYRVGSTAGRFTIDALGTSQSILIRVAGTTPDPLFLAADNVTFMKSDTTEKGRWTNVGLRIGPAANPTHSLEVVGDAQITGLGTGVVHASSAGVLSSSVVSNSDITDAAIAVTKLTPGTSTQFLVTNSTPAAAWVTAGGDWTGAVGTNTVIGLTGTGGSVAMHGTKILWDSNGPSVENSSGDLILKMNTTAKAAYIYDTTHEIGNFQWNGGNPVFQFGATGATCQIVANAGTSQTLNIIVAGTTPGNLGLYCDSIIFGASNTTQRANIDSSGLHTVGGIFVGSSTPKNAVLNASGSALATSATDGFTYIPTCAGTPTGDPTDYGGAVPMVYDTSANKLWINVGGTTWKFVALS